MSVTSLHSADKIKILVVDDQPVNIQIIHQMLCAEYQIFMATSGALAISLCQNNPPDLILLDVLMPELDGLATCRLLKQKPELAQIPVIFVTGMQSQEDENVCWEAGGADFVIKPVNPVTLRNRIKTQLKLKQQQDLLQQLQRNSEVS
jgi:PleD family two-component response regulator